MKPVFLFFLSLCFFIPAELKPLKLESIHPEWRREPSPHDRIAMTNPPVLFVPTNRDKWKTAFLKHDFQISREANFASIYASAEDL